MEQRSLSDDRRFRRDMIVWCSIVFLAGLAGRLFFVLFSSFDAGDQPEYLAIAANLVQHGTFALDPASPTVFRPPGYPFFLAAVRLLGGDTRAALIAQSALGAGAGVLLYLWLRRCVDERVARFCAVLVAVYPHLSFYAATILSETILSALLVAFVYFIYRSERTPGVFAAAMAGLFGALVILFSPRFAALPLIGAGSLLVGDWPITGPGGRKALAFLGVCAAALLPWTVRNYLAFDIVNPSAVQSPGLQFWLAAKRAHPYDYDLRGLRESEPLLQQHRLLYAQPATEQDRIDERIALERALFRDGLKSISEDRPGYAVDRLKKYPRLWIQPAMYAGYFRDPFTVQNKGLRQMLVDGNLGAAAIRLTTTLLFVVVPAFLVLLGVFVARTEWRRHLVVYLILAWVAVSHAPLWIEHRYSVVVHPLLAMFCALALDRFEWRSAGSSARRTLRRMAWSRSTHADRFSVQSQRIPRGSGSL